MFRSIIKIAYLCIIIGVTINILGCATEKYVALALSYDLDPAQMALAYVNSRPFLTSTIIGATNMEQLKANIASEEIRLDDEVLEGIEAIHSEISNPSP